MRELAVTISNANKNVTPKQTIQAVKQAGFKNVFVEWYDQDWEMSQEEQVRYCKELGLKVIFAHLGYNGINDLWVEGEKGDELVKRYIQDIKNCKAMGIDLVCMHLTSKYEAPQFGLIGLNRIQKIIDAANEIGVRVSFENTKIPEYIEYVMENIQTCGFCLDSGHLHAHFHDQLDFSKFDHRIYAVHLHDNDGKDDQHLIPFEGNINWQELIKHLKECHYQGPITLELIYRNDYLNMDIADFYKKGYEAAKRLSEILND
ncbi:MAG: sugar phosphate isomerase/epimerase family protein [Traorella sp.]